MNRESEILRKKYISKVNTVNNIKLAIIAKIKETHIMFLQPRRSECLSLSMVVLYDT